MKALRICNSEDSKMSWKRRRIFSKQCHSSKWHCDSQYRHHTLVLTDSCFDLQLIRFTANSRSFSSHVEHLLLLYFQVLSNSDTIQMVYFAQYFNRSSKIKSLRFII
ncbi:hypothetical protein KIL84_012631 [Mauremys mutica]|uniref:Uncharacterized protein n=1 Tax=Mauremys mutica TaxID=74926 RepID=A0A9D3XT17_9SAUR|nr:hypothetical protein KIL84_012631 [Mauremys mutica]